MNIISVPQDRTPYPALIAERVMTARIKLGASRITLSYRIIPNAIMPVLNVEFYNEKGKLYSLRYHLPPDTPERTDRRLSLLLHLIEKEASQNTFVAFAL